MKMFLLENVFVFLLSFSPSKSNELSQSVNLWAQSTNDAWDYNATTMELSTNTLAEIILLNKQWYNADGCVSIDYTYSIEFNGRVGSDYQSGLLLWNGKSASYCEWHYISIRHGANPDKDKYWLGLARGNAPNDAKTTLAEALVELQLPFVEGQEYTLSIKVCNGHAFTIWIDKNDNPELMYDVDTATSRFTTLSNGYSGYIGLFSESGLSTRAKHLSISGSSQTVTPLVVSTSSNCVSLHPTKSPSKESSPAPTDSPTQPTKDPTSSPSNLPSGSPTKQTSDAPSLVPSPSPFMAPSSDPVVPPSQSPSVLPTNHPVITPSHSPSQNPTRYPTNRPTVPINTIATSDTHWITTSDRVPQFDHNTDNVLYIVLSVIGLLGLVVCILGLAIVLVRSTDDKKDHGSGRTCTMNATKQEPEVAEDEYGNGNMKIQMSKQEPDLPESDASQSSEGMYDNEGGTGIAQTEPDKLEYDTKRPRFVKVTSLSQVSVNQDDDGVPTRRQCEDCGQKTDALFELDGHLYCKMCRESYDEDADGLYEYHPPDTAYVTATRSAMTQDGDP
eukprot:207822_1